MPELEQLAIAFHETGVAEEETQPFQKEDDSLQAAGAGMLVGEIRPSWTERVRRCWQQVANSGDAARSADYCQRSIVH